jgi:chromosome partitioning protein
MAVIALLNQKGGVGKTTLTANLGGAWARQGRTVLLVDNDPQSSLTQGLLGPEATAGLDPSVTIAALYDGSAASAGQAVRASGFPGLDLLAGSEHAARYNHGAPHEQPWERQTCLADALAELSPGYDRVLVDCPPNLNVCSWAALAAADAVLVPVQPEDYGAQGLPAVRRSVEMVRRVVNPRLRLLGLLISMLQPRRAVHQLYVETLRGRYGAEVFATMIPEAAEVAEATMLRTPVAWHKPRGATAKALAALAAEIDGRLSSWGCEPGQETTTGQGGEAA